MKELFVFKHGAALQLRFLKRAPRLTMFIWKHGMTFSSVQFGSVAQLCPNLWDPMGCSTPRLPVHHQLLEELSRWTHVHWVSDAIQPSPPAFDLSQHQGLLKWVSSSHHVAKVLEFQLHHQSFQWISGLISFRMDWLDLLAVHRTLKNLLQAPQLKSINSSVLRFLFMFLQTFIHVLFSPDTWIHYHTSKT